MEEIFINIKSKNILEHLYENMNILFNNKFPTDLHIAFHIIKLLIEKGNLNLIHNQRFISTLLIIYQEKENWINYIMRCNSWTIKSHFTYLHYIYQISFMHFIQLKLPQETRKIDCMISFYIQETSYTKWKENTA